MDVHKEEDNSGLKIPLDVLPMDKSTIDNLETIQFTFNMIFSPT